MLMRWHEPVIGAEPSDAITIDLAPFTAPRSESNQDIAPGPDLQEATQEPEPEQRKEQIPEKIEVPPTPEPEVALPPPEEMAKPLPKPMPQPTAPTQTAPQRQRVAAPAEVQSWYRRILVQLGLSGSGASPRTDRDCRSCVYDRSDRRIVTSRIIHSSGVIALDQEALATLKRAQPFPTPPAALSGATFDFTVPIRFNIR